jgi:hypothetical protein
MAIKAYTGAERGDLTEASTATPVVAVNTTAARTGTYGIQVNPSGANIGAFGLQARGADGAIAQFNDADLYVGFWFRFPTALTGTEEFFVSQKVSPLVYKFSLRLNSSGNILAYGNGGTTLLATGTTALAANTWHHISCRIGTGASATWEVRINEAVEISGTSDLNTANHGTLRFGKFTNRGGTTVNYHYDDIVVDNATYPPKERVVRIMTIDGDGNYTAWVAGTGSGGFAEVDELPHDGDITHVRSVTSGQAETSTLISTATAGITGTVHSVAAQVIVRDEGAASVLVQVRQRSDATDTDSTSSDPGAAYVLRQTYHLISHGLVAWTLAILDGAEIGVDNAASIAVRYTSGSFSVLHTPPDLTPAMRWQDSTLSVPEPVAIGY